MTDKKLHFAAGFAIVGTVAIIGSLFTELRYAICLGEALCFSAAIGKEIWDEFHAGSRADWMDFFVTCLGGIVAILPFGLILR